MSALPSYTSLKAALKDLDTRVPDAPTEQLWLRIARWKALLDYRYDLHLPAPKLDGYGTGTFPILCVEWERGARRLAIRLAVDGALTVHRFARGGGNQWIYLPVVTVSEEESRPIEEYFLWFFSPAAKGIEAGQAPYETPDLADAPKQGITDEETEAPGGRFSGTVES